MTTPFDLLFGPKPEALIEKMMKISGMSTVLAMQVIATSEHDGVKQSARNLLQAVGITYDENFSAQSAPEPESEPARRAVSAPVVNAHGHAWVPDSHLPAESVIVWPPAEPRLPAHYTENYYIAREEGAWAGATTDGTPDRDSVVLVSGTQMVFQGESRWDTVRGVWVLLVRPTVQPQWDIRNGEWSLLMKDAIHKNLFWVSSKDIKPGDEIPKEAT